MSEETAPGGFRPGLIALMVSVAYIALCGTYVHWSSRLAERWAGSIHELSQYEVVKGWGFVVVTGIAFYLIALFLLKRIAAQEVRLRQNEQTLVLADRQATTGVFAGAIAHDIGNTLTVATAAIASLEEPAIGSSDRGAAHADLKRAIEELRQLARRLQVIQGGRVPGPVTLGLLAPTIRETVRFATSHPRIRSCQIELALDETARARHIPLTVGRILLNLILNSADATGGKGKILIRLWRSGNDVYIEAHDNGSGIAPEMREKIFEPLFTSKADGTGLGLVSVKVGAEELGATVTVIDSPLGGACFRVAIPT